jgi:histidine triad (HIT) family protein
MIDDVFCKIISGELPGDVIHRDEEVIVIRDIHAQAPTHLLVIPVAHYSNLGDFSGSDEHILGKLLRVAHEVAAKEGLGKGYRLIINEGEDGGKLVPHLHIHLLGGKKLGAKIVH